GTLARPTTRNPVWHMGEWGLSISQCHTAGSSYRHPRRDSARESILARVARLAHPTHIARPFGPSRIRKPEAVRFRGQTRSEGRAALLPRGRHVGSVHDLSP